MSLLRISPAAALALALSGCWNFDTAYDTWCHERSCDGGAGGGVAGGSGGGVGGGAGGGAGGGTARICQQTLCLVQESFAPGLGGLVGGGATSFTSVRAVGTDYAPTPDVSYSVTPAGDGGMDRMPLVGLSAAAYRAEGLSADEVYVATGREVARIDASGSTSLAFSTCGAVSTAFWAVSARAPGEAWGLGSGGVICKLANNTPTLLGNWGGPSTLYLYDLYQAPTGEVFIAASDSVVHSLDGGALSGQLDPIYDPVYDGLMAIDGTSATNVWAVGRNGSVARLDAGSGRFDVVFDAGTDLHDVLVRGENDVWIAQRGSLLLHWDGAQWSTWPMPGLKPASVPDRFIPVPGGFHLAGLWSSLIADPDRGFLITYAVKDAGY